MCSNPFASARSVPGIGARCMRGAVGGRRCAAGRPRCAARRRPGPRRSTAWPAAWCPPGWRRPAGSRRPRRCRPAGTAARGRPRTPGCRRSRTRTCRTGRCSRSPTSQRDPGELAERVGLFVGQPAAAEHPDAVRAVAAAGRGGCRRRPGRAPRPRWPAAAGWSGRPATVRTSGVSSRSVWSSRSAAVQPLEHSPPRLVGKSSCGCSVAGRSPATIKIPHCREQYGQWVAVGTGVRRAAGHSPRQCRSAMFRAQPRAVLRADCVVLTFAGQGCALDVINHRKTAHAMSKSATGFLHHCSGADRPAARGEETPMPETLLTGIAFGESPRWHDGRLWFCRLGRAGDRRRRRRRRRARSSRACRRVPVLASTGCPTGACWSSRPATRRCCAGSRTARWSPTPTSAGSSDKPWNEIVVDGRGNAYVNGIGFDFPGGEFAAGHRRAGHRRTARSRQVADGVAFPNGMAVTPDNSTLIVAESYAQQAHRLRHRGRRQPVEPAGLGRPRRRRARRHLPRCRGRRLVRRRARTSAACGCARAARCCRRSTLDRGCFACMLGGAGSTEGAGPNAVHHGRRVAGRDGPDGPRTGQVLTAGHRRPGWVGRDRPPRTQRQCRPAPSRDAGVSVADFVVIATWNRTGGAAPLSLRSCTAIPAERPPPGVARRRREVACRSIAVSSTQQSGNLSPVLLRRGQDAGGIPRQRFRLLDPETGQGGQTRSARFSGSVAPGPRPR